MMNLKMPLKGMLGKKAKMKKMLAMAAKKMKTFNGNARAAAISKGM